MKTNSLVIAVSTLLLAGVAIQVHAQKGMGDAEGIARQAVKPEIVTLSGTVLEVKTERCELATGRSDLGMHLILETSDGEELNIHLGPKVNVAHIARQLKTDQELTVAGFRTEKMPENNYVAQTLTLDEKTIQVRDENLRPVWAGGRAMRGGRGGSQWGTANRRGQGRGQGFAQGQGRGQGQGIGNGQGRGRGQGMGNGQGRGQGQGIGNGQGRGRGQGMGNGQGRGQRQGMGNGQGRGQRQGMGNGQGRGRGQGMGNGQGRGRGQGMGNGQGRGQGQGMGNGQGRGRGQGRGQDAGMCPWQNSEGGITQGHGGGPVQGFGQGRGQGMGQGRGQGRGQGMGQGRGQGQGWAAQQGRGQGFGCRSGRGDGCGQQMAQVVDAFEDGKLSRKERKGLLLMREEEKLAHDVYVTLYKKWSLRPLANIPQAESRHMEAIKMLLDRYDLEDPITDTTVGKFQSKAMQKLYDELVEQGETSIEGAIQVGALIEELDIADLRKLIEETDNDDIKIVYQNLLKGSRNHLRAFARQLARNDATYETKHLSQEEFDRIAKSDHERGTMISDPDFKF